MFTSQRLLLSRRVVSSSASTSSVTVAVAASGTLNRSNSNINNNSSSNNPTSHAFHSTQTLYSRFVNTSDPSGGLVDEDPFNFGDDEHVPPAPPSAFSSSSTPSSSSSTLGSGAGATTTTSSSSISSDPSTSSSSSATMMSAPGTDQKMRYAPPPKTVTLPDGTEEPASEFMVMDPKELIELIRHYLSNRMLLPDIEAKLFNALLARAAEDELTCEQLLDVLEKPFPLSTNERWGEPVKLMIRDRCMKEASALSPLTVARAIVLVGLNGRARRDVDFFKKMCKILSHHVNEIKDPHTLCYVLVGLQNSRIKPPESFLALVGRRFPILNKKNPLYALPAFRALTFFSRAEYPLMNPYRYLADRIMAIVRERLRLEGKGQSFDGLGRVIEKAPVGSASLGRRGGLGAGEEGGGAEGSGSGGALTESAGEELSEISALSDEDFDILKGLQREDKTTTKPPTPTIPQEQEQEQPATLGAWGTPPPAAASAAASSPPQQQDENPTSFSSEEPGADTATAASVTGEGEEANNNTTTTTSSSSSAWSATSNSVEASLRSASAIPRYLKAGTEQDELVENANANTTSASREGEKQGGENVQNNNSNNTKQEQQLDEQAEQEKLHHYLLKQHENYPSSPEFLRLQFEKRTNGISPVQFVRLLYILALKRAPRQQYLRPIAGDLLVPIVPILPPPSFMRLVISMRLFQSEEKQLIGAVLKRLEQECGGTKNNRVCLRNLFELLRLFGHAQVPVEVVRPHLLSFIQICKACFEDESKLRAKDMLAITGELRNIYQKLLTSQAELTGDFSALGGGADDWMDAVKTSSSSSSGKEGEEGGGEEEGETKQQQQPQKDEKQLKQEQQQQQLILAVEEMFLIVERFANRMTNLMSLGVLALTNAETLLEICKSLPASASAATTNALQTLRDARRRVDEEDGGGADAYAELLDIDVREIFFRIQVVNNYDTFKSFRPLPANLVGEFKGMLDAMRCDFIIEAVHLYEQAFPGTLAIPVKRLLARHILEKMAMEMRVMESGVLPPEPEPSKLTAGGKIIEVEQARVKALQEKIAAAAAGAATPEGQLGSRPFGAAAGRPRLRFTDEADAFSPDSPNRRFYQPYDCLAPRYQQMLFNAKKFSKFVNMLAVTPLKRVRNSEVTWKYVEVMAAKLKLDNAEHIKRTVGAKKQEMVEMSLEQSEAEIRGVTSVSSSI